MARARWIPRSRRGGRVGPRRHLIGLGAEAADGDGKVRRLLRDLEQGGVAVRDGGRRRGERRLRLLDGRDDALHRPDRGPRGVAQPGDAGAHVAGDVAGLLRQRFDVAGDGREGAPGLAGARRFDGGVQRKKVGLTGHGRDRLDDPGHLLGRGGDAEHQSAGAASAGERVAHGPPRILHGLARAVGGQRQLLGRGREIETAQDRLAAVGGERRRVDLAARRDHRGGPRALVWRRRDRAAIGLEGCDQRIERRLVPRRGRMRRGGARPGRRAGQGPAMNGEGIGGLSHRAGFPPYRSAIIVKGRLSGESAALILFVPDPRCGRGAARTPELGLALARRQPSRHPRDARGHDPVHDQRRAPEARQRDASAGADHGRARRFRGPSHGRCHRRRETARAGAPDPVAPRSCCDPASRRSSPFSSSRAWPCCRSPTSRRSCKRRRSS